MTRRTASAVASSPRRHFGVAMTVAAIAVFSVLAGTGASYAYWTAGATRSVTASTGDVAVTIGGFVPGTIQNHVTKTVGFVTVANTTTQNGASTTPATLSLRVVRDSGSSTFAAAASVEVWRAAGDSSANCTLTAALTSGSQSGNWNTGVTVPGSLAKGASAVYCVRTTVGSAVAAGDSTGTTSFVAKATATLNVHNFTGTASVTPTMNTAYIYPLGTPVTGSYVEIPVAGTSLCVDVEGGDGSGAGAEVIPWGCHGGNNQQWRFAATTTAGYFELNPLSSTTLRITAASATSGSAVTVQNDDGTSSQDWQVQVISGIQFQLVNRQTGYCLTTSSVTGGSNNPMTQAPCAGTANQRFQTSALVTPLAAFDCTVVGGGNNRNLTLSWTSRNGTFRLLLNGTQVASQSGTLTGMTVTVDQDDYPNGTYPYTVLDAAGLQVASGQFTMSQQRRLTGCTP